MSKSRQARQPEQTEQPAGSPSIGEPAFLVVGKIRKPHGVRGEVSMEVITHFPERLQPGTVIYIGDDYQPYRIRSLRWHGRLLLLSFDTFHDPESAGVLRNQLAYVRAEDRPPLPDGEYYHHQLLGLRVVSDEGDRLGILHQILETGANDVYIVRPEVGREILLPATEEVVLAVDLDLGEMRVHLLPGLLPE